MTENTGEGPRGSEGLSGHITLDHFHLPCQSQTYGSFQVLSHRPLISQCFSCSLESSFKSLYFNGSDDFELRSFVCMPSCLTCSKENSLREVCSLLSPSSSAQHRNWACSRYFYYYCYYYYFTLWLQDEYLHQWCDAWYAINEESYILRVLSTQYPGVKLFASWTMNILSHW